MFSFAISKLIFASISSPISRRRRLTAPIWSANKILTLFTSASIDLYCLYSSVSLLIKVMRLLTLLHLFDRLFGISNSVIFPFVSANSISISRLDLFIVPSERVHLFLSKQSLQQLFITSRSNIAINSSFVSSFLTIFKWICFISKNTLLSSAIRFLTLFLD